MVYNTITNKIVIFIVALFHQFPDRINNFKYDCMINAVWDNNSVENDIYLFLHVLYYFFSAMKVLDGDHALLSSRGLTAERDIVQVCKYIYFWWLVGPLGCYVCDFKLDGVY